MVPAYVQLSQGSSNYTKPKSCLDQRGKPSVGGRMASTIASASLSATASAGAALGTSSSAGPLGL